MVDTEIRPLRPLSRSGPIFWHPGRNFGLKVNILAPSRAETFAIDAETEVNSRNDFLLVFRRPVINTSETINVSYGIGLIQILDLDEKNQILTTNVWCRYVSIPRLLLNYSVTRVPVIAASPSVTHLLINFRSANSSSTSKKGSVYSITQRRIPVLAVSVLVT